MAVPKVEVDVMWNDDALKAGTTEAAAALEGLESSVNSSSTAMKTDLASVGTTAETELGTTVPAAADTAAVGLTTKASKFKAVGTELGQTLAQGIGSGVSGPEQVANLGTSVAGLAAPLAATGVGAIAAIGLGLGGALISNMIKAANERKAEFVEEVVSGFTAIEVKARSTFASIRQDLLDTYDTKALLEEVTKLGIGTDELRALSEDIGAPWYELAEVLRGDINPANKDTLESLRDQAKELDSQVKVGGAITNVYSDQAKLAQDLLGISDRRKDALREQVDLARLEKEALEGSAQAARELEAATIRIGGNLGNAVRQAGLLDLALGG
jgi:hypothetical protein